MILIITFMVLADLEIILKNLTDAPLKLTS